MRRTNEETTVLDNSAPEAIPTTSEGGCERDEMSFVRIEIEKDQPRRVSQP
jgi:hypothetical protein